MKKKIISGIFLIFLISLPTVVIWTGDGVKDKNTETDLTESKNGSQEIITVDDKFESVSLKVIAQEILQDKTVFYLEDETETQLCIPNTDLIYEENGIVYEDSEKRIEFSEDMAVISKVEANSEPLSQISRNQKGE